MYVYDVSLSFLIQLINCDTTAVCQCIDYLVAHREQAVLAKKSD